jgi:protein deglycase
MEVVMSKKVLIVLADGFEDIEAITPIDVLKRAELEVVVAGLSGKLVTSSHGLRVEADVALTDYRELPDAIVLPGGLPGSKNLAESKALANLIQKMNRENKTVGAICAAPALALAPTGILDGRKATCYPGFEKNFSSAISFSEERVVIDGNVVTSRGPGSALEFSIALAERLAGKEKAEALRNGLLVQSVPT